MNELIWIFWYWWVLALILLVAELLVTGFFFLWMAAASVVTGMLLWLLPMLSNPVQILLFSTLSIAMITAWRLVVGKKVIKSDHPLLNKRGAQYIGRVFDLYEAIENGQGKIKVDDTIWKVRGEDCGIDAKVKVVAVHGTVFDVQRVH